MYREIEKVKYKFQLLLVILLFFNFIPLLRIYRRQPTRRTGAANFLSVRNRNTDARRAVIAGRNAHDFRFDFDRHAVRSMRAQI